MGDQLKKILAVIMTICMLLSMTACQSKQSDTSLSDVVANGTLKVGVVATDSDHMKLNRTAGTYSGLEADLSASIGRGIGVSVTFIDIDLEDVPTLLANKDIDMAIGNISTEDAKKTACAYSVSYADGYLYVVTPPDYYGDTFGSFANMSVGLSDALSSTYVASIAAHTTETKIYMDSKSAANAISDGEIVAFFCYETQAKEMLQLKDVRVRNLMNTEPEKYVIVTAPAAVALLNGINMIIPLFLKDREAADLSANQQSGEE